MVELVDTQDLKSCDPQRSYRFKSDPGHNKKPETLRISFRLLCLFLNECAKSENLQTDVTSLALCVVVGWAYISKRRVHGLAQILNETRLAIKKHNV